MVLSGTQTIRLRTQTIFLGNFRGKPAARTTHGEYLSSYILVKLHADDNETVICSRWEMQNVLVSNLLLDRVFTK